MILANRAAWREYRNSKQLVIVPGTLNIYLRKYYVDGEQLYMVVERIDRKNDILINHVWLSKRQIELLNIMTQD